MITAIAIPDLIIAIVDITKIYALSAPEFLEELEAEAIRESFAAPARTALAK